MFELKKNGRVPALPNFSSARLISGAKMTGMARKKAGSVVLTSHENAGKLTAVVISMTTIINRITPRSRTTACVSLTTLRITKKIMATRVISRKLNQFIRWKINNRSLKKSGTKPP